MSMTQQIIYSAQEVEDLVVTAYQSGINHGYALAVQDEVPQLTASEREQERIFIQNWQGICESREGDECGHC